MQQAGRGAERRDVRLEEASAHQVEDLCPAPLPRAAAGPLPPGGSGPPGVATKLGFAAVACAGLVLLPCEAVQRTTLATPLPRAECARCPPRFSRRMDHAKKTNTCPGLEPHESADALSSQI